MSLQMVHSCKPMLMILATHMVAVEGSLTFVVCQHVPTKVLFGDETCTANVTDVKTLAVPSLMVIEVTLPFETVFAASSTTQGMG